ncbi:FAD dependent oxidoreductase [Rhizobium sp. PP-WC-2G-219]|nr:FAD dependent oxidoreductase [Rhizobium sp. PP-WC-2G-219]
MSYKIAIIGGGWYGCHIALALSSLQMEVDIYEKSSRLLSMASGNNQFRLHQGFHYARHHGTRVQSREGFIRFTERYPSLSAPVEQNLYAVPKQKSLMDFETYKLVMVSSGLNFVEMPAGSEFLHDVEGVIRTNERVILLDRARRYFSEKLDSSIILNTQVTHIEQFNGKVRVEGNTYDYVVDATWGHHTKPPVQVIYEPTILLYYETKHKIPAVTFVDGPLCSVYPTEDAAIFTLSSVPYTPLGQFTSSDEARVVRDGVTNAESAIKRRQMEQQISENMPQFRDLFSFAGVQLAIKTKPIGNFDDRSCHVYRDGNVFSVMSGKIDTVFFATERILALIEAEKSDGVNLSTPAIKKDIILQDHSGSLGF